MDKLTGALALYTLATDDSTRARILSNDLPRALREEAEAVADRLPPLSEADVKALCNGDHTVMQEVERWRDARWSGCDVSELRGNDPDEGGGEAWTILRGSSRFEVREVSRYEVRSTEGGAYYVWDNEENDTDATNPDNDPTGEESTRICNALNALEGDEGDASNRWIVVDTDDHDRDARDGVRDIDFDSYDPCDEGEAQRACEQANVEDYRQNAAGWPWAQNHGWAIDEREADDFHAAGFVVATHEPSGQVYAGIDGGNYSFLDAHWCPLYLRYHLHGKYSSDHIYIPTSGGLRRVVRDGAK